MGAESTIGCKLYNFYVNNPEIEICLEDHASELTKDLFRRINIFTTRITPQKIVVT